MSFDPRLTCRALNDTGVDYVVDGGFATVIYGSPLPTSDVDVVPDREQSNLDRLRVALVTLGPKLRMADGPVDAPMDGASLAAMPFMLNLSTSHGDLDLTFEPSGPRQGFEAWNVDATDVEVAERGA